MEMRWNSYNLFIYNFLFTFSKFSKNNVYHSTISLPVISNSDLGISTVTMGNFKFANSKKEFKKLIHPEIQI